MPSNMGLSGEQDDSGENDSHSVRILTFPLRTLNPKPWVTSSCQGQPSEFVEEGQMGNKVLLKRNKSRDVSDAHAEQYCNLQQVPVQFVAPMSSCKCVVSTRFIGKIQYYKCENEGNFLWFPITRIFWKKRYEKWSHSNTWFHQVANGCLIFILLSCHIYSQFLAEASYG